MRIIAHMPASGAVLMAAAVTAATLIAPPAGAQQAPDPARAVQVRLADGGRLDGMRLAGIVMRLAEGWKTYWRVPGEGGLPPRFDFSGSDNVARVQVLWPAPKRFDDPVTGETIGYKDMVVFPLLVTPGKAGAPVQLQVKMDYGICGRMCVPMQGTWRITLAPQTEPDMQDRALLRRWLARTPRADDGTWQVRAARYVSHSGPLLEVVLQGPEAQRIEDVFVEGVELAVFGKPRIRRGSKGVRVVRIPVRGLARREDFTGASLRLTIVLNGEKAVERRITLAP